MAQYVSLLMCQMMKEHPTPTDLCCLEGAQSLASGDASSSFTGEEPNSEEDLNEAYRSLLGKKNEKKSAKRPEETSLR